MVIILAHIRKTGIGIKVAGELGRAEFCRFFRSVCCRRLPVSFDGFIAGIVAAEQVAAELVVRGNVIRQQKGGPVAGVAGGHDVVLHHVSLHHKAAVRGFHIHHLPCRIMIVMPRIEIQITAAHELPGAVIIAVGVDDQRAGAVPDDQVITENAVDRKKFCPSVKRAGPFVTVGENTAFHQQFFGGEKFKIPSPTAVKNAVSDHIFFAVPLDTQRSVTIAADVKTAEYGVGHTVIVPHIAVNLSVRTAGLRLKDFQVVKLTVMHIPALDGVGDSGIFHVAIGDGAVPGILHHQPAGPRFDVKAESIQLNVVTALNRNGVFIRLAAGKNSFAWLFRAEDDRGIRRPGVGDGHIALIFARLENNGRAGFDRACPGRGFPRFCRCAGIGIIAVRRHIKNLLLNIGLGDLRIGNGLRGIRFVRNFRLHPVEGNGIDRRFHGVEKDRDPVCPLGDRAELQNSRAIFGERGLSCPFMADFALVISGHFCPVQIAGGVLGGKLVKFPFNKRVGMAHPGFCRTAGIHDFDAVFDRRDRVFCLFLLCPGEVRPPAVRQGGCVQQDSDSQYKQYCRQTFFIHG